MWKRGGQNEILKKVGIAGRARGSKMTVLVPSVERIVIKHIAMTWETLKTVASKFHPQKLLFMGRWVWKGCWDITMRVIPANFRSNTQLTLLHLSYFKYKLWCLHSLNNWHWITTVIEIVCPQGIYNLYQMRVLA